MKRIWTCVIAIILLVVLDQGAKLIIEIFYEFDLEALSQEMNTIHIHPLVNYESPDRLASYAEKTGIDLNLLHVLNLFGMLIRTIITSLVILLMHKVALYSGAKRLSVFLCVLMILVWGAGISSILDRMFWDGTHDFICVSWSYFANNGRLKIGHLSCDIKDIYLKLFAVLLCIYAIFFERGLTKLRKDKEAREEFKSMLKDSIKSICHRTRKGAAQ